MMAEVLPATPPTPSVPGSPHRTYRREAESDLAATKAAGGGLYQTIDLRPLLADIRCPTLVLVGKLDLICGPVHSGRPRGVLDLARWSSSRTQGTSSPPRPRTFREAVLSFCHAHPATGPGRAAPRRAETGLAWAARRGARATPLASPGASPPLRPALSALPPELRTGSSEGSSAAGAFGHWPTISPSVSSSSSAWALVVWTQVRSPSPRLSSTRAPRSRGRRSGRSWPRRHPRRLAQDVHVVRPDRAAGQLEVPGR